MSPSPRWSTAAPAIPQAIDTAWTAAWEVARPQRVRVFTETLRQILGGDTTDAILATALALFGAQPNAPEGFEPAPPSARLALCVRCQRIQGAAHRAPNGQKVSLLILRDRDWMATQIERGRSVAQLARQARCTVENVRHWLRHHDITAPKTARADELEVGVRHRHQAGEGPGDIARALDCGVSQVRKILARLNLANQKHGQVYHEAAWWRERLITRGWTTTQCARSAGIRRHACAYWVKQFGLETVTRARASRKGQPGLTRHPVLRDAAQLRVLLNAHHTYEAVARVVGCSPSLVSFAAQSVLGVAKRHRNVVAHAHRAWWTVRLDQGLTIRDVSQQSAMSEKSAAEYLRRRFPDLLALAYRNAYATRQRGKSA